MGVVGRREAMKGGREGTEEWREKEWGGGREGGEERRGMKV